jgi:hypothetical protein|tara:strand:+ start:267 stop:389 length:123 start_codon:yes stop_codon:yes gene_type:complete
MGVDISLIAVSSAHTTPSWQRLNHENTWQQATLLVTFLKA